MTVTLPETVKKRIERGACFCGAIVSEFHGDPFWICFDHDADCRRAIGSPVVVWVGYRPEQVRLIQGYPKTFSKTPGVVRTFCAHCGTSMSYLDEGIDNEIYIALGFFDCPENFHPEAHAYWSEKLSWIRFEDQLPRIEAYSRARNPALGTPKSRNTNKST